MSEFELLASNTFGIPFPVWIVLIVEGVLATVPGVCQ